MEFNELTQSQIRVKANEKDINNYTQCIKNDPLKSSFSLALPSFSQNSDKLLDILN